MTNPIKNRPEGRSAWTEIPIPVMTIDFEASSLLPNSYPIEIGLAVWHGIGQPIKSWSTLIKPTAEWIESKTWIEDSQKIHGITLEQLDNGLSPAEAMQGANAFFHEQGSGVQVICDGGVYDQYWMSRLSLAAGSPPAFRLTGTRALLDAVGHIAQERFYRDEKDRRVVHRAGPDAEDLLVALLKAIGITADIEKRQQ